jgi:CMP-N-acetylneuraminic acid synthetase
MGPRYKYLIPARKASKRFPGKNQVLMPFVWKMLPERVREHVILSTDDEELLKNRPNFVYGHHRPAELCTDEASMLDVIADAAKELDLCGNDVIITLYPTYIDRTWQDVQDILDFFKTVFATNLLCADPIYDVCLHKCFFFSHDNGGATPIVDHGLYRKQDYPGGFEASCFVVITKVGHIPEMNNLLWSPHTTWYQLDERRPDIDTLEDFKRWAASCA